MSDQAEVQKALSSLTISSTPHEWTSQVWEQNFCEGVSLPPQLERNCVLKEGNWARLVSASKKWLENQRRVVDEEDG